MRMQHVRHLGKGVTILLYCLTFSCTLFLLSQGSPHDALKIAADVGSEHSFATHWGTWCMSDERWDEPLEDLKAALQREKLPRDYLKTLPFGQTVQID